MAVLAAGLLWLRTEQGSKGADKVLAALSEKSGAQCAEVLRTLDDGFWREATSAERRRIVELLVAEAVLREDRLELVLQCEGIKSIMEEIENESDQN